MLELSPTHDSSVAIRLSVPPAELALSPMMRGPVGPAQEVGGATGNVQYNSDGVLAGSPNLKIAANGQVQIVSPGVTNQTALSMTNLGAGNGGLFMAWGTGTPQFRIHNTGSTFGFAVTNMAGIDFSSAGLQRADGAFRFFADFNPTIAGAPLVNFGKVAGGWGTTIEQDGSLTLWNTRTDASNYARSFWRWNAGVLEIGVEKAGTGSNAPISFFGNSSIYYGAGAGGYDHVFTAGGVVLFTMKGSSGMLQFGGNTSAFPALKRNGAGLDVRLADDSAFASLTARDLISSGGVITPSQYTNATEPSWVNGNLFFNTDLDKLRLGGAAGWETVTSA